MLLNLQFDPEASRLAQKIIFSCERYELRQEDITQLKKDKLIKYVQEEYLPTTIPCQVLMFLENPNKAQIIFFNPTFILPEAALEDNFLNRDLIEQCSKNGWFWLEIFLPLNHKGIKLHFSYETWEDK